MSNTKAGVVNESQISRWSAVAASQEFAALLRQKRRFVVPATVFFILYYFALPVLVGYFPAFMDRRVWGPVNLAYLFALSQFVMAWVLAWLYVRAAARFDRVADELRRSGEHVGPVITGDVPVGPTGGMQRAP
jgi:uncharacterized membrane protein (DUF485 family)